MKRLLGLVAAAIMIFSLAACSGNTSISDSDTEPKHDTQIEEQLEQAVQPQSEISKVDLFIEKYNEVATTPITDTVEVDVTDKESGHYRTQFRLGAFSEVEAKTGHIGDTVIDIVCYGRDNEDIRVYADGIDLEQAKEIVKIASPVMDSTLSDTDLQNALSYIDENKEANGYYYGNLGMILLGKHQESYELMLEKE